MRRVLVTGFGAFPGVATNPSAELARALAARPPAGLEVRASELPVEFAAAGAALDAALADLARAGFRPDLLLGLGVHRGPGLRIERGARRRPTAVRRDNAGLAGVEFAPGDAEATDERLATDLALEPLAEALVRSGASWSWVSGDAGGYVCERAYFRLLSAARRDGARALFVHVPHAVHLPLAFQARALGALLHAAAAQLEA